MKYKTIAGRIGIIMLLTGIIIALVSQFRDFNRLSSSTVTIIWAGLIIIGTILLIVFVTGLALKKQKPHSP